MSKNRQRQDRHQDEEVAPLSPLKRIVRVDGIRDGQEEIIEATPAEIDEIASLQDLNALKSLVFTYTLRKIAGGGLRLKGRLQADATQNCVVTLEPVPSPVDIPVTAEFWTPTRIEAMRNESEDDGLADPLAEIPEPITDGTIDLGTLIYETFSLALDPYPRRDDANFQWESGEEPDNIEEKRENPFAALKQLKLD